MLRINGIFGLFGPAPNDIVGVSQAHADAIRGVHQAREAAGAAQDLEDRVDQLVTVNLALWSLLKQKLVLTEEELIERVKQIDLADGVPDGKVTGQVRKCSACGRVMHRRHKRCMYCGADRLVETAFDGVM